MRFGLVRILFLGFAVFALASGCGKEDGGIDDALVVSLSVPPGEPIELFWYGVVSRKLDVVREDKSVSLDWAAEKDLEVDLTEGDRLVFQGLDRSGRLLITGEVTVGAEKRISIPLRRVL